MKSNTSKKTERCYNEIDSEITRIKNLHNFTPSQSCIFSFNSDGGPTYLIVDDIYRPMVDFHAKFKDLADCLTDSDSRIIIFIENEDSESIIWFKHFMNLARPVLLNQSDYCFYIKALNSIKSLLHSQTGTYFKVYDFEKTDLTDSMIQYIRTCQKTVEDILKADAVDYVINAHLQHSDERFFERAKEDNTKGETKYWIFKAFLFFSAAIEILTPFFEYLEQLSRLSLFDGRKEKISDNLQKIWKIDCDPNKYYWWY